MGKPLACYKGIIYTSSIEEANDLTSAINEEAGEQLAQAIHSQVKDYKKWIELFRKKRPGNTCHSSRSGYVRYRVR